MKDTTKKLCLTASELYESKNYPAHKIFELLLNSKSRIKEVSKAKQLVSYFLYNHYNMTFIQIANEFKMINHSSVLYHVNEVHFSLRTDKRMKYRHDYMLDIINGVERTILRNKPISRNVLSDDDKKFIDENVHTVSYYSDILNKNKGVIRLYLQNVHKERKLSYIAQQIRVAKMLNTRIDY